MDPGPQPMMEYDLEEACTKRILRYKCELIFSLGCLFAVHLQSPTLFHVDAVGMSQALAIINRWRNFPPSLLMSTIPDKQLG